jgi:DNA-binding transcriptional MerR regulator
MMEPTPHSFTRKQAADKMGISPETLRYYEKIGLIREPERAGNRYRQYSEADIVLIDHILRIKKYGFTLREIKHFIDKNDYRTKNIRAAIKQKIAMLDTQMGMLEERRKKLHELLRQFQ